MGSSHQSSPSILLLLVFQCGGNPPYSETAAQWSFRVSFAFIAILLIYFIYIRVFKLRNADQSFRASKHRSQVTSHGMQSLRLANNIIGIAFWLPRCAGSAKIFPSMEIKSSTESPCNL